MERVRHTGPRMRAMGWWGAGLTVAYGAVVLLLLGTTGYTTWGGVLLGPLLVAVSLPVLARQADREGDRRLFWLLSLALVLKLARLF